MTKIIYTGFFVNQEEVLEKFPVDTKKYPNVFAHHCTSTFKPTDEEVKAFENLFSIRTTCPKRHSLMVIARLQTEKVDVLLLENSSESNYPLSKNKHPHITLATAEGIKPFESNTEILRHEDKIHSSKRLYEYIDAYSGLYTSDNKVKKLGQAVVVDIDRTLCNIQGDARLEGEIRSPYDWDRVAEDKPIEAMCQLVRKLQADYHIILLTGRSEDAREGTEKWLRDNLIDYDKLLMKASGSYEKSTITKYESYVNDIRDEYDVAFAIDDDQRVVDMWRENGIMCLKVDLMLMHDALGK